MSPDFVQTAPRLDNPFTNNTLLKAVLKTYLPEGSASSNWDLLNQYGQKIVDQVHAWGRACETNPPVHTPYSAWGQRVDDIQVHEGWNRLAGFAAEQGLIADGYERNEGENSRLLQMAKLFLYHPSSAFFSCPLAMTDGAAKVLEQHKDKQPDLRAPFNHLTSRDPKSFWTSGQWMTEKTGGSDVSDTSTVATPDGDRYLLSGVKWFSSSTTSEMALALARIQGDEAGSRGLSLFYVPMRNPDGTLNGITVNRLKDKMGTKALPTAELTLNETRAWMVGEQGKGVKTVASMLNITRLYNSVCSVAQMDRALHLLQNYAYDRTVFKKALNQQPLFRETLAEQKARLFAALSLTFEVSHLLGKEEMGTATESELGLLRFLTPLTKLYTAKQAVWVTSECLEGFGGAGYCEDTEIPVLFRDAQVFPIWEGATNVMSLDVLRVMKDPHAMIQFLSSVRQRVGTVIDGEPIAGGQILKVLESTSQFVQTHQDKDVSFWQSVSRDFSWSLSELYAGLLMLEHASKNPEFPSLAAMARRWMANLRFTAKDMNPDYQNQTNTILELNP